MKQLLADISTGFLNIKQADFTETVGDIYARNWITLFWDNNDSDPEIDSYGRELIKLGWDNTQPDPIINIL